MHIKFAIFFYKTHIRFLITSANFVEYGWTIMENIVYYQDFPILPSSKSNLDSHFRKDLKHCLSRLSLPPALVRQLDDYDFSKAIGKLVMSLPGIHSLHQDHLMGLMRLQEITSRVKLLNNPTIVCQCSSLGRLDWNWIESFSSSLCGTTADTDIKFCFPSKKTRDSSTCSKSTVSRF